MKSDLKRKLLKSGFLLPWVLVLNTFLFTGSVDGQVGCARVDACTCEMNDGSGQINLHSIDAGNGGVRFNELLGPNNWYFSYNPCAPFTKLSCSNAAACQSNVEESESYTIALADTADFGVDESGIYLGYTGAADPVSGSIRITTVSLNCDPNAEDPFLVANGEPLPLFYTFTLVSKCACPGMCAGDVPKPDGGGGEEEGISGGSVLCIIFFSVLAVYLVAGVIFNKYKKDATGKDLVPNVEFWSSIPGYIKDGFKFTIGKVRRDKTYDSI